MVKDPAKVTIVRYVGSLFYPAEHKIVTQISVKLQVGNGQVYTPSQIMGEEEGSTLRVFLPA